MALRKNSFLKSFVVILNSYIFAIGFSLIAWKHNLPVIALQIVAGMTLVAIFTPGRPLIKTISIILNALQIFIVLFVAAGISLSSIPKGQAVNVARCIIVSIVAFIPNIVVLARNAPEVSPAEPDEDRQDQDATHA